MRNIIGFMLSIVTMFFTAFTLQAMESKHVDKESSYQVSLGVEAEVLKSSFESNLSLEVKQKNAQISHLSTLDAKLVSTQEIKNASFDNKLLADGRILKPPVNI